MFPPHKWNEISIHLASQQGSVAFVHKDPIWLTAEPRKTWNRQGHESHIHQHNTNNNLLATFNIADTRNLKQKLRILEIGKQDRIYREQNRVNNSAQRLSFEEVLMKDHGLEL